MAKQDELYFEVGHVLGQPDHRFVSFPSSMTHRVVKPLSQQQYSIVELSTRRQITALATLALSLVTPDEVDDVLLDAEQMREERTFSLSIDEGASS